ncbi:MAG: SDR family oxidoreductase [Saprospiraceae bacterium]|nr:SDR family oxidoreductase [Saprospiraceae bacterium]
MELLAKKNVLIIGATGGIGEESTKLIKNNQANVFITGRDQKKLDQVAKEYEIPADQVFKLDIVNAKQVQEVADKIHAKIEKLDILVNAAGIGILKPIGSLTAEDFSKVIDVNLKGTFNLLTSFLPPMKSAKKGLIINIPGVLGKTPMAGAAAYAASKYGVNGMLKSVREELRRTEVRITNLYLGGVDSPFWDNIDMKVNRDKFITAREAGRAVWFLCQQPSSGVVSEMVIQPFNHQAI